MGRSLVEKMPYKQQNSFRLAVLEHLLLVEPEQWRLRRTERYSPVDLETFAVTTDIDIRIRRHVAVNALDQIRTECPTRDQSRRISLLIGEEKRAVAEGSTTWDTIDGLLPVGWVYGPMANLVVTIDGKQVVPLARYQTAEVVSHCLDHVYMALARSFPTLPRSICEMVWALVAVDSAALHGTRVASLIRKDGLATNAQAEICEWFEEVLEQVGFSDTSFLRQRLYRDDIKALLGRSYQLMKTEYGESATIDEQSGNAFWNPLLGLRGFLLKRVSWDQRDDDVATLIAAESLIVDFLVMCNEQLELLEWVQRTVQNDQESADVDSVDLAMFLAEVLFKAAWFWPIIVRCPITVDAAHRLSYAMSGHFEGGGGLREQRYPLTAGDALSYHVEVSAPHQELRLKRRAGLVEIPVRDFKLSPLKTLCDGRAVAAHFPFYRFQAKEYFGRADESSTSIHSYYDAPLTNERLPLKDWAGAVYEGNTVYLVVPHEVLASVWLTNLLVTVVLVSLSAYLVLLSAISVLNPTAVKGVDLVEIAKSLSPVFAGVVLLFTLERHNNLIVAARLKLQWYWIVFALVMSTISVVAWSASATPTAWPYVGHSIAAGWEKLITGIAALIQRSPFI